MLTEIKRRLVYNIWQRLELSADENWNMACRMIDRVIDGKDSIDSIKAYISQEDYKFIEEQIKVVKIDPMRMGGGY